jgi:two-component system, NtrC family, sensor kinase
MSAERRQDFFDLLHTALRDRPAPLDQGRRPPAARAPDHAARTYGLECPPNIAEMLVNIGVDAAIDPYIPLLCDPLYPRIVEMVYHLVGLQESAETILIATKRAAKIVFALKTYARQQADEPPAQMTIENIVDGIETTLTLYRHHLKRGVDVVRRYDEIPAIPCYPDELNQVWTNLIQNAMQAMAYQGTLTIESSQQHGDIVVSITDSGAGIPADVQAHIFEPFFTTKPVGEGTGLGLDIVKKIIQKHHGTIAVTSRPGATTFCVHLPMRAVTRAETSHTGDDHERTRDSVCR